MFTTVLLLVILVWQTNPEFFQFGYISLGSKKISSAWGTGINLVYNFDQAWANSSTSTQYMRKTRRLAYDSSKNRWQIFVKEIGVNSVLHTDIPYKRYLIPTLVCTQIQGLAYIIYFLNKYSFTESIYTFRTLPFPAMISLLVRPFLTKYILTFKILNNRANFDSLLFLI